MLPLRLNAQYTLRTATADDVQRIAEIWIEGVASAFGESAPELPPLERIQQQLLKLVEQQTDDFKFWLCLDDSEQTVGWSTVQPFHTTPLEKARNSYGFISTYMSDSCRGKGTGSQLMQFTVDYCRANTSIIYILGIQDRSNAASVKMTDRAGFCELGQLPAVVGTPICSVIVCQTD
jgi:L-amino acid N-acyltransferase YncA